MPSAERRVCLHCGLPCPSTDEYCCPGCKLARELLLRHGLGEYYALRDESVPPRPLGDTALTDYQYSALDDEACLEDYGGRQGDATLELPDIHCAACVWALERLPQVVPGVLEARVDYGRRRLRLRWDPQQVRLSAIASTMHQLGYPCRPADQGAEAPPTRRSELRRLGIVGALAGNVMLASTALYADTTGEMATRVRELFVLSTLVLALPIVTYGAWPFYRGAYNGLRLRTLHMDLPIALGIVVATTYSVVGVARGGEQAHLYFDSAALLVFLLLAGRYALRWGQRRAGADTDLWAALVPETTTRLRDGHPEPAYSRSLKAGDQVLVPTNEVVPADGVLHTPGRLDNSILTGESRPTTLSRGEPIFAGSRNVGEPLSFEVTSAGNHSRLGKLVESIESGTDRRPRIEQLVDRGIRWFVCAVLGLAAVGTFLWWSHGAHRTVEVVVALLVVACPCALGLATPLALHRGRAAAARAGFVIATTDVFERLGRVREVCFDKTGTLTQGRTTAQLVWSADPAAPVGLWVRHLEYGQAHPLARALRHWAAAQPETDADHVLGSDRSPVDAVASESRYEARAVPGCGVVGRRGPVSARIGSPHWIPTQGSSRQAVQEIAAGGRTPVVLELDGVLAAVFAVDDPIRPEAALVVHDLRARGLQVRILSGDAQGVVDHVARAVGISEARGGLSPEEKASALAGRSGVLFVGDGVNDAPALAIADVGIAVGGAAEPALAAAAIYARHGNLTLVPRVLEGATRVRRVVRRNLGVSVAYNLVFAAAALAGHVDPLTAAIAMPLSSLTVVLSTVAARMFSHPPADPDGEAARTGGRDAPASPRISAGQPALLVGDAAGTG